MTWVIHRASRNRILNTDTCEEILLSDSDIIFFKSGDSIRLPYENKINAKQAFGYLMDAIKRGDKLTNI